MPSHRRSASRSAPVSGGGQEGVTRGSRGVTRGSRPPPPRTEGSTAGAPSPRFARNWISISDPRARSRTWIRKLSAVPRAVRLLGLGTDTCGVRLNVRVDPYLVYRAKGAAAELLLHDIAVHFETGRGRGVAVDPLQAGPQPLYCARARLVEAAGQIRVPLDGVLVVPDVNEDRKQLRRENLGGSGGGQDGG
eukprot:1196027-Prorocentrum_minimum.AAC.4